VSNLEIGRERMPSRAMLSRPFIATVSARGAVTVMEGGARLAAIKRG
jgi:hypothetical protein